MKEIPLREVQLMQLNLIKSIDRICNDNGIQYYMIAGSCLGAMRHKGFIPWDDDIDIAMMRSDYDKFISIINSIIDTDKYFVQNYDSDEDFAPALSRICIKGTYVDIPYQRHLRNCKNTFIDIFPLDNVPDGKLQLFFHKKIISIIDKLISYKLYHLYRSSAVEKFIKGLVSQLLSILPLRKLQTARVKVMSRYSNIETTHVTSTCSKYGYDKQIMSRSIYGTPVKVFFEDTLLCVPEHTLAYLNKLYGESFMKLPSPDQRAKTHKVYQI